MLRRCVQKVGKFADDLHQAVAFLVIVEGSLKHREARSVNTQTINKATFIKNNQFRFPHHSISLIERA